MPHPKPEKLKVKSSWRGRVQWIQSSRRHCALTCQLSFSETLKTFIPSCRHWLDTETVKCRPQYNLLPFYLFLIYLICFCEQQPGGRRQLVPLIQYQIMLRCRHQFSLIHVHPERKSINMLIISRLKWNVNCDFNWTKPVALMTLRHVLVLFHLYYICV